MVLALMCVMQSHLTTNMKNPLQLWNALSPETRYEISSFVRTFFTGFLIDIVAQPNLTKAVIAAAAGAALRSATKSVLPPKV